MDSESKSETETYDNAKPEMETTFSNPWNVSDLSDFLRYCCPECDYRCEQVHSFCNHAIEEHENAKVLIRNEQFEESHIEVIQELDFEDSENFEVVEDFDLIKEEYNFSEEPKTPTRPLTELNYHGGNIKTKVGN